MNRCDVMGLVVSLIMIVALISLSLYQALTGIDFLGAVVGLLLVSFLLASVASVTIFDCND